MTDSRSPKPDPRYSEVVFTEVEWFIMDVVWRRQPCAAGTVQEALEPAHGWAYSTVKTTMDRMVRKGILATTTVRNLTLYSALVDRKRAQSGEFRKFLRRAFSGAVSPMIQFLVDQEELTEEDLNQLRELIKKGPSKKAKES